MTDIKLICSPLPNIPWQDRPAGCTAPMWRHSGNPVIRRNPLPNVSRIFNSAVVPYKGGFMGVFRGEQRDGVPHIYLGSSADGLSWNFQPEKLPLRPQPLYAYDPRLVEIDGTYYAIWCQDMHGASVGMAKTTDFTSFTRLENPFLPYNRNAVLFPRRIGGNYMMLSRPCDNGHTAFGDIFLSESPDLEFWGRHRHVMGPRCDHWWENMKIGAGAAPIETNIGWLLFYHGVVNTCNGYVYSVGAAILDIAEPSRVLHRCADYILCPEEDYEERGFVPNVTFPCATLQDSTTGRIAMYYGCADSYVGVAYTTVDEICRYILAHDSVTEEEKSLGIR